LPGLPDPGRIEELHAAALEYAAKRDERMDVLKEELDLKGKLLDLMKKHDRTVYITEGLECTLVPTGEKLKVKVHKADEDEELAN
jgi:hypothetical protein